MMATSFMAGTNLRLQSGVSRPRTARSARAIPRAAASSTSETVEYVKTLPGISAPFDAPFFDPAGFSKTASIKDMRRWRESEVTHGRVAMLAALGFIVGENLEDFPILLNFDGNVNGPAIYHFQQVRENRPLFWESLVLAIGLAESFRVSYGWAVPTGTGFNSLREDYTPGDLGFDPLGLKPEDPEELKELQTKELNNGRLAMIGIAGFVAQELVNQTGIFEHLALGIEKEIILELDDVERIVGVPETPLPDNLK